NSGVPLDAAADRLVRMCRHGPLYRFHVGQAKLLDEEPVAEAGANVVSVPDQARSLGYHPVIVGPLVLVADQLRVVAFDAVTGRAEVWFDLSKMDGKIGASVKAAAEVRTTLTVADGRVYARLGRTLIGPDQGGESWLVCLSVEAGADGRRLCWARKAGDVGGAPAVFEGTPLVQDGRLHVAVTSFQAGRTVTTVRCYSTRAMGPDGPSLLWEQELCQTQEFKSGQQRGLHHLLTRAGPLVVACSHSGAVVALDAATGRRAWAVRYPPSSQPKPSWPRDLAP